MAKLEYDAFIEAMKLVKRSIHIIANIGKCAVLSNNPKLEKMSLDGLDELEAGLDELEAGLDTILSELSK